MSDLREKIVTPNREGVIVKLMEVLVYHDATLGGTGADIIANAIYAALSQMDALKGETI